MNKKIKLDIKTLENLYNNVENISNFITLEEIKELLNKDIESQLYYTNLIDSLSFNTVLEKLYNGTYKLFKIYVDVYADNKLVYSKKTGKRKYNELIPYVFRISVFDQYNNNVLFNINVDKIRSKRILEEIA